MANLRELDAKFPNLWGETTEEKVDAIEDYLVLLNEQMRYTLANMDADNFNETGLTEIGNVIQQPLLARLENAEGNIATLTVTTTALTTRMETAEGNISTLTQTEEVLEGRVEDAEGNITTLTATTSGLTTRVTSAEGDISTLEQTASGLESRVTSAEGDITTLQTTASGLTTRVTSAEGNITTLQQTASSLTTRVSDTEGNITTLQTTTSGLSTRVSDAEGDISALEQTAAGLTTRVGTAEGNITTLQTTASGLTTRVTSAEGNITTLQQTVNGLTIEATDGTDKSTLKLKSGSTELSSAEVKITGMVKFSDLSGSGSSTINGDNITTGTITAITMKGCTFKTLLQNQTVNGGLECYYSDYYSLAGGIKLDASGTGTASDAAKRMFIYTNVVDNEAFALKLQSAGGMSLKATANLYMQADNDVDLVSNYGDLLLKAGSDLKIIAPKVYPTASHTNYWEFRGDGIYYGGSQWHPWQS